MTASSKHETTDLLTRCRRGDRAAAAKLFDRVYDKLKEIAERTFRSLRRDQSLQPTALVHEAFIRLVDRSNLTLNDRAHFFALAARAMRQILIDHVRARSAGKRGAVGKRIPLDDAMRVGEAPNTEILALHESLNTLAELDERKAKVVELRFFGGCNVEEIARVLNVSKSTVEGDWRFARAWLSRMLSKDDPS